MLSEQPKLKVFVVEDSPFVRERVIDEIVSTGRAEVVDFAETEGTAMEKLQYIDCDAIILDLSLRQGTGFQVLRLLRAVGVTRPYVIVFTDYAHPHFREQTMELGADFFLDKAKDFDHLGEIIERLSPLERREPN